MANLGLNSGFALTWTIFLISLTPITISSIVNGNVVGGTDSKGLQHHESQGEGLQVPRGDLQPCSRRPEAILALGLSLSYLPTFTVR